MPALSSSAKIRAQLDHPVIDADGHTIEYMPAVREHLKGLAGAELVNKVFASPTGFPDGWYRVSEAQRLASRRVRPPWWGIPTENTLDRATAMLPGLMHQRLDECGVDFAIVYPTIGLMRLARPWMKRGWRCVGPSTTITTRCLPLISTGSARWR